MFPVHYDLCMCLCYRLEAELEERRLKEREALMTEYQLLKDAAQKDIDDQKEAYEEKMSRLTRELVIVGMKRAATRLMTHYI